MSKKILLILCGAILIAGGAFLFQRARSAQSLKPNQTASTGVTIVLSKPASTAELSVKDSQGKTFKQHSLTGSGTRYNIELPPGVYTMTVTSPDNLFPPLESSAVTVTGQKLTQVSFEVPNSHDL